MGRTKQTAQKSTGGRCPRKQLPSKRPRAYSDWPTPEENRSRKLTASDVVMLIGVKKDTGDYYKSPDFLDHSRPFLSELLASDELHCPEEELVLALIRWGKNSLFGSVMTESDTEADEDFSLREELAELIPLIRFPLLRPDFIEGVVLRHKLLTCKEAWELSKYCHATPEQKLRMNYTTFSTRPRAAGFGNTGTNGEI